MVEYVGIPYFGRRSACVPSASDSPNSRVISVHLEAMRRAGRVASRLYTEAHRPALIGYRRLPSPQSAWSRSPSYLRHGLVAPACRRLPLPILYLCYLAAYVALVRVCLQEEEPLSWMTRMRQ